MRMSVSLPQPATSSSWNARDSGSKTDGSASIASADRRWAARRRGTTVRMRSGRSAHSEPHTMSISPWASERSFSLTPSDSRTRPRR